MSQIPIHDMTLQQVEESLLLTLEKLIHHIDGQSDDAKRKKAARFFATGVMLAKENRHFEAARFMRKAAMHGHARAQYYLGVMFHKGVGVPHSDYHAFAWLTLAQSAGVPEAIEAKTLISHQLTTSHCQLAERYAASLFEQIENLIYDL